MTSVKYLLAFSDEILHAPLQVLQEKMVGDHCFLTLFNVFAVFFGENLTICKTFLLFLKIAKSFD